MNTLLEALWYVLMGIGLIVLLAVLAVVDALMHRDDTPRPDEPSEDR